MTTTENNNSETSNTDATKAYKLNTDTENNDIPNIDKPENRPAENTGFQRKSRFIPLAQAGVFAALIIVIQSLGIIPLTGVIVNAVIVTMALTQGIGAGIALCILPSSTAFLLGVIPAPLLPMQPIIILGNMLFFGIHKKYCNSFAENRIKNFALIAALAAVAKAFLICAGGWLLLRYVLPTGIEVPLKILLGIQFFTAFAGSFLAWGISKKLYYGSWK